MLLLKPRGFPFSSCLFLIFFSVCNLIGLKSNWLSLSCLLASSITRAPPLSVFGIMVSFFFGRSRSASRSDIVRLSRGRFLVSEDFISWSIAVMKVSKQLGNLSSNQLLLLLNLNHLNYFRLIDPKSALSLILR